MNKVIATLFCALLATPLMADKVRLNVGFWPGDLEPELENRLLKDDLIAGRSFNRINLAWSGKETYTMYPLGAQYILENLGPGDLLIGGNYIRYAPEYKFNALGAAPSISIVSLDNFLNSDWEAEAGYRLGLLDKKLFVTPKVGGRWHFQEFDYNELTIGSGTLALSAGDNQFRANAKGTFVGAGLQYYVTPSVSVFGDFIMTSPLFGNVSGAMTDKRTVLGIASNAPYLTLDNASGGYQMNLTRFTLGAQYDITPELHLQAGIREETTRSKYPGYVNLPITIRNSGASIADDFVTEIVTDILFWEAEEVQKKGFVFLGVSYDINL